MEIVTLMWYIILIYVYISADCIILSCITKNKDILDKNVVYSSKNEIGNKKFC